MKQYILIPALILLSISLTLGQQNTTNTNMKFYHIDVEVSIDKSFIKGAVKCEFVAVKPEVTTLTMDLADQLKVSKIEGAETFEQKNNQLFITLSGDPLKKEQRTNITIHYEGEPPVLEDSDGIRKGLVYDTHGKNDNPVIASVCYPNGGFLWFPCKKGLGDKVDSIYIDVTIEDKKVTEVFFNPKTKEEEAREMPIIVVSNGKLEGVKKVDENKKKYEWRHRHRIAPHHVLLAISNFMKAESEFNGRGYKFPIDFYLFPEKLKESSAMMRRVPEIMTCLTNTFGPYPYRDEGFNVTQVGIALGMDGMPTQTNVLLEDMKATHMYKVVHQMASMWFGNHISPKAWQDAWITEALATYAEAMWQEYKRGLTVYQIILDEKEYFEGGKLYLDDRKDYSEERLSKKGMYAIHMLRGIMSDTYFFETLKAITSGKRMRGNWSRTYLSTDVFREICEYYASENVERNYKFFFDQWIRGEFYPSYKISYSVSGSNIDLNVQQSELESTPSIFTMPYKIEVELEDGTVVKKVLNDDQNKEIFNAADQNFKIQANGPVKEVRFDPSNWIFKDLKYTRKVTNDRFPIKDLEITTSNHRRKLEVKYNVSKKQDVTIELFQVADGISLKEDKSVNLQTFKKEAGEQSHLFKIPLGYGSRGVFKLVVTGKGETFTKILRLKRIKEIF
ncbi:M1 family aminopeptidase [Aureispira anguillae]|uniref:Peptidase M1 n=1 Tax=Aureispira anguillae TaxID=2864201 RepID=A0A916DTK9_9BACT|nr:M1 family aminopeptidase [Aureispira anguillae]BDS11877.1 peptidase M1 [Aureispira anguillae]